VIQLVAAVPQLLLNLTLLPRLGPVVAAYTNTMALIVQATLNFLLARKYLAIPLPWRDLTRASLAAAVMAATVMAASAPFSSPVVVVLVRISTGLIVYALMAIWLDIVGARARAAKLWRIVAGRVAVS
jgi:peptidoglycan biosynthesis protein MviN/MurJ (putative lipid II flippase)